MSSINPDSKLLAAVASGSYHQPHEVLGIHKAGGGFIIRTLRPLAKAVFATLESGLEVELNHLAEGIWQTKVPEDAGVDYRIRAVYESGNEWVADDPYRHLPTLGELDLHLISEGRHERLWEALGSRIMEISGPLGISRGTAFRVWAPNASAVRVMGDFNHWNGVAHAMRSLGSTGVWELFIPGVEEGTNYKYEILTKSGSWITKIDPLARLFETPPLTASVVFESSFGWQDQLWMNQRSNKNVLKSPLSVYEVHLASWKPGLGYRELANELISHVKKNGFTHVEFMPIAEHPFGGSWGYQVTGYYAPTSRLGSPDDFRFLVDELHQAGIGVILDWVPAHFPKDDWALSRFDGEALYEHADPRQGEHPDWGTLIFNYGRNEVRNFLVANALYWFDEFHVDGLRVDAVASMLYLDYSREGGEWLPNQFGGRENLEAIAFLQEVNATAYKKFPGIMMIAEESTSWPGVSAPTDSGGLGFGFKWNMGWMHDTLQYITKDPGYRSHHHGELTFSMLYAYNENFLLPISHDEVVHGKGSLLAKMPGDRWQQLANLRAYLLFMWSHPGKKLLFMGQEFAQPSEWSEERGLDWWILEQPTHQQIENFVSDLNHRYLENTPFWNLDHEPRGFSWIDSSNANQNVLSFIRLDDAGDFVVVIINFSGHPHHNFRLGLPGLGSWQEIINSDDERYGGSGVRNQGLIEAEALPSHGQPYSAELSIPPLGGIWLKLKRAEG